MNDLTSRIYFR